MKVTIEKKTDQLNFEDFLGGVTRTVTIAGVKKGSKEQQYDVEIDGDQRVWRPAVTVLKILVAAWGDDAKEWVGRRAALYGDPTVTFGRERVGGIRVSHLSHIDSRLTIALQETRGKKATHTIEPLVETQPDPHQDRIQAMLAAYSKGGITHAMLEAHQGRAVSEWDEGNVVNLAALFEALKSGDKKKADEFPELDAAAETDADA